jgi:endonuclease/exonuclease/phosphatase family metal-dependent hydrolase
MKRKTNSLKIISYNLKYHRANKELAALISRYDADILCVQECHADKLPDKIGHMVLGEKTVNGKFNLAIYYRKGRFFSTDTSSHVLKDSLLERMYMPQMERLLVTKVYDRVSRQEISIGSFHATHLIATNYLRRTQIKSAHDLLASISEGSPAIMVGDYNYPLFKRGLKVCVEESGYELSLSDRPTYYLNKFIRAHFDLATSINTEIERVLTLPKGISDHAPILVQVAI